MKKLLLTLPLLFVLGAADCEDADPKAEAAPAAVVADAGAKPEAKADAGVTTEAKAVDAGAKAVDAGAEKAKGKDDKKPEKADK